MAALVLAARGVSAQPESNQVDFVWVRDAGAESCPDQGEIEREITARLGRDVFSRDAARSIRARITRDENGRWKAEIEEHEGGRLLTSRAPLEVDALDCTAIKNASVFVIAVLIDSEAGIAPSPPLPPSPPPLTSSPPRPRPSPPQRRLPPSTPLTMTLMVRGAARSGLVPGLSPEMALFASAGRRWWEVSVGVSWTPEARTDDDAFAFGLAAMWFGGCLHPLRLSRVTLSMCGYVLGGAVYGDVVDLGAYMPVDPDAKAWAAASLSLRLRIPLISRLLIEFGGDLTVPLTRYRFYVQDLPDPFVFEQARIAGSGFVGVGLSIP